MVERSANLANRIRGVCGGLLPGLLDNRFGSAIIEPVNGYESNKTYFKQRKRLISVRFLLLVLKNRFL